jgi:hypothetical protein
MDTMDAMDIADATDKPDAPDTPVNIPIIRHRQRCLQKQINLFSRHWQVNYQP